MSDEKWEKMEDWEIKICKRIEELEGNINNITINLTKFNADLNRSIENRDKIEELEKIIKALEYSNEGVHKEIAELKEQINMLEEHWARQQENIDYNMKFITNHTNKIRDAAIKDDKQIKDVLRELINECVYYFERLRCCKKGVDPLWYEDDALPKLLAKLSGVGSARQTETYKDLPKIANDGTYHIINIGEETEKKEVVSVAMRECFPEIYNEDGTKKESGGDSIRGLVESNVCIHGNYLNEPCPECKTKTPEPNIFDEVNKYKPWAHKLGLEFDVYDPDDYSIVKREDLRLLLSYTGVLDEHIIYDIHDFLRIKEEYSL